VEFALILPVFLVMTLGVVDGARIFSAYIAITNAAREGALYAASGTNYLKWCQDPNTVPANGVVCPAGATGKYGQNPDNIAFRVQQESQGLTLANVQVDAPTCPVMPCGPSATRVTVKVHYEMNLFVPLVSIILGDPVEMDATTTAMIQ
jgi:Flp pilus assembly protein TadG